MLSLQRIAACALALLSATVGAAEPGAGDETYEFRNALVIGSVGRSGRNPFHTDALEQAIVAGTWTAPREGETVSRPGGDDRTWRPAEADKDGVFSGSELRGGYLYSGVVLTEPAVRVLEASGHNTVYVNGEPRAGDPYSNGILELPVQLHAGTNHFLFNVGRGRLRAKLVAPKHSVYLTTRDSTLPDIIRGESGPVWGAIVLANATDSTTKGLSISASASGASAETELPPVPPFTVRKVPFRINPPSDPGETNSVEFAITLHRGGEMIDSTRLSLRLRQPSDHYKQTFRSEIDGSIQYYAVAPPNPLPKRGESLALFLSTHGASVEAMGQADAYASKPWGYLVAPTNRRPYGFDWEDWGRGDAMEVLNLAQVKFGTDPAQTYLTGHSMGGHGAWQLGVTFPGRFAAVAPSAGWISFWSYAGARRTENASPLEALIQRASTPSDTLALASNYLQHAIYILHGDKDDNVPVSEARKMKERLSEFHRDFLYHEQPGAGHWWGNACVDWPPIFNLFARHKIPESSSVTSVKFSTANPGVSASNHWVTIEAQQHALARSSVDISYEAGARKFTGTTENVARLSLDAGPFSPSSQISVELDGEKIEVSEDAAKAGRVRLEHTKSGWSLVSARPDTFHKGPLRNGPFKEAFKNRMIFVYATRGSTEENRWAYAKARYDAETWWYRGNGAVDIVADTAFNPSADRDRGVILYGNADNNAAWPALLGESPVQVRSGAVSIGDRQLKGQDLACLFIRPRPGSTVASVAAVSGTGPVGLRLTDRVPYFLSGVAYPDCTVFGIDSLAEGVKGVRVAGFFGNDWSIDSGEFEWRISQ